MATDTTRLTLWLLLVLAIFAPSSKAVDPFARYTLDMYDRPGFPAVSEKLFMDDRLLPLWLKALGRPDAELRRTVIDTLAIARRRGMEQVLETKPELVKILTNDQEPFELVYAAAAALVTFDARSEAQALARVASKRQSTLSELVEAALVQWKSPVMEAEWLQRITEGGSSETSMRLAIEGLAAIETEQAKQPLTQIVFATHRPQSLRVAAARGLGAIHDHGLIDIARRLMDLPNERNHVHPLLAIEILDRHRDETAADFLELLVKHENVTVQGNALARLSAIDAKRVDRWVDDCITSRDVNVRRWCARAMVTLRSRDRIPLLARLLDDVNPSLRTEIGASLIELAGDSELRDGVLAQVNEVLKLDSWRGCEQAAFVVAKLDYKPAGERLIELLSHKRPEVKVASAWSLAQLRLEHLGPKMFAHAQTVYRSFQNGTLNDSMPGASLQVAHLFIALGDLRYREANALMRAYVPKVPTLGVQSRPAAAWALGMIYEDDPQEDLIKMMLARLNDVYSDIAETEEVRQMCAVSLGRMKAEAALPHLRKYAIGMGNTANSCLWSIERLTGEPIPEPAVRSRSIGSWFLEPSN